MTKQTDPQNEANLVRLVGRVSGAPVSRILPSGDEMWTFRVVVPRPERDRRGRAQVDALECSAWSPRSRRSVRSWREDDIVSVEGRLRRRFFAAGAARQSRVDVEMRRGRLIRRAGGA